MNLTIRADELLAGLQAVTPAVAPRTTKPVLAGVKCVAADGVLELMATDLEVGLRQAVTTSAVTRPGACVLTAPGKVVNVLKELGAAEVQLTAGDGEAVRLKVSGRKDKWDFPTADPAEFPDVPGVDESAGFVIEGRVLLALLKRVSYAAARKDNSPRYTVHAVQIEAEGDTLRFVATDLKRLAVAEVQGEWGEFPTALLPLKGVALAEKLAAGGGPVRVVVGSNDAVFASGGRVVYTRLVQGKFPLWRQIVPKKDEVTFGFSPTEFGAAVKRAAVTSDDESKRVDIAFRPGVATLTARGPDTGASEVEVELPGCETELDIAFDPSYLLDVLGAATEGGGEVTLALNGKEKPAVIRWQSCFCLIMPMGDRD